MNILDCYKPELETALLATGIKKFRAAQIYQYLFNRNIFDIAQMTQLSNQDVVALEKNDITVGMPSIVSEQNSADGATKKILLELSDGNTVESVWMQHNYGNSVCISTQVGCAMDCQFCASAKNGLVRNLTAGEMVGQLLAFKQTGMEKLHSIVIMGSGEPLNNYDEVVKFMRLIHEAYTFNLGYRNMTLSTSGIVPNMYKLADEGIPVTLAVSLHAPNDTLRSELMPINRKYGIRDIIKAADHYFDSNGRQVTYEYVLIKDKNSSLKDAEELADLLRGRVCHINLIPLNDNYKMGLRRPIGKDIQAFADYLENRGLSVTVRREMGSGIQAACGQLQAKQGEE